MPKQQFVYILKTVNSDMTSWGNFKWPTKGQVSCSDWDPTPRCGGGLHGFLKGEGDGDLADWDPDANWLVIKVAAADVVKIDEAKCKFPAGNVVHCGDRLSATNYIQQKHPEARMVIGATVVMGNHNTATAGDRGTAIAGYEGTAVVGDNGTAAVGRDGTATAGDGGTAIAGEYGTATAGDGGTATAGDRGIAAAGRNGTATAGHDGTATAGHYGAAIAGDRGIIQIKYWDEQRHKIKTGYIGEDGLKPNIKYKLDKNNNFVEA